MDDVKDFFEIFDTNNDGQLNEDDQILILSTIKERIYETAINLKNAKIYELFRSLMKELRLIEKDINQFQVIYYYTKLINKNLFIVNRMN